MSHANVRIPWDRPGGIEEEEQRCRRWSFKIHMLTISLVQRWKFIYIRDILLDVVAHSTTCGVSPTVGMVMDLDRRIRDYDLYGMNSGPAAPSIVYQRNIMFCIKESTLAYLHRSVLSNPAIG
jgi:hypothetical protein